MAANKAERKKQFGVPRCSSFQKGRRTTFAGGFVAFCGVSGVAASFLASRVLCKLSTTFARLRSNGCSVIPFPCYSSRTETVTLCLQKSNCAAFYSYHKHIITTCK